LDFAPSLRNDGTGGLAVLAQAAICVQL
jgi:hypothetical protein